MPTVVFYISGHGFGHAAREIEVINALLSRHHGVHVVARTTAPEWLFARTVKDPLGRFRLIDVEPDTGVAQIDSLHLDESRSIANAVEFMRDYDARVEDEAAFLRSSRADLVVCDIPPLGISAARRARITAVGLGNFTWDWIYSAYAGSDDVVRRIGDAYADAELAMRLPMHGGFASFRAIVDVPFIARRSSRSPEETKARLGLPTDRRLVLVSFGGYGLERVNQDALERLRGCHVVGSRAHPLDEAAMYEAGFRYEDLVRAVDVVVTKPGYGIISECIANDTAILYTDRGHFIEYDVLVREMPRYLRCEFIDHQSLFSGEWQAALDRLTAQPSPAERPAVNGADVVADRLFDMI